jgi:hypothetical protein
MTCSCSWNTWAGQRLSIRRAAKGPEAQRRLDQLISKYDVAKATPR